MLTKKEVKNLRMWDTTYHGNMECRVVGLFKDGLSIESVSYNEDIPLRYDDEALSLTPPKKKVKMYLYARPHEYSDNDFTVSNHFYSDNDSVGEDWIKVEGSMIEVEE